MRIKPAYQYQISELKRPVIIYYIVILALCVLAAVSQLLLIRHGITGSMGGFDGATVVFLFVCGLNAFRQQFHMFLANGISRKTMFVSAIAAFGTASIGMAIIDGIISVVMSLLFRYNTLFENSFGVSFGASDAIGGITLPLVLNGFVWSVFCYMAAAVVGLFITTAYYRMNRPLKLIISIGLPVLLFIVMPVVDASLFNGAITVAAGHFFRTITSLLGEGNPYSTVLVNTFSIVIFGGLTWLLMRRATVKSS